MKTASGKRPSPATLADASRTDTDPRWTAVVQRDPQSALVFALDRFTSDLIDHCWRSRVPVLI